MVGLHGADGRVFGHRPVLGRRAPVVVGGGGGRGSAGGGDGDGGKGGMEAFLVGEGDRGGPGERKGKPQGACSGNEVGLTKRKGGCWRGVLCTGKRGVKVRRKCGRRGPGGAWNVSRGVRRGKAAQRKQSRYPQT
jgi:hypothetical protein